MRTSRRHPSPSAAGQTTELGSVPEDSMQEECQKIQLRVGWELEPSRLTEQWDLQRHPKGFWSWGGSLSRSHRTHGAHVRPWHGVRLWSMEVVINSWYAINCKFKKRNLKQPKNVSCWSPLPRLPGEYTYLIWGGCRCVWGRPSWTINSSFHRAPNTQAANQQRHLRAKVFWAHTEFSLVMEEPQSNGTPYWGKAEIRLGPSSSVSFNITPPPPPPTSVSRRQTWQRKLAS